MKIDFKVGIGWLSVLILNADKPFHKDDLILF
jgi:hypothetical protein